MRPVNLLVGNRGADSGGKGGAFLVILNAENEALVNLKGNDPENRGQLWGRKTKPEWRMIFEDPFFLRTIRHYQFEPNWTENDLFISGKMPDEWVGNLMLSVGSIYFIFFYDVYRPCSKPAPLTMFFIIHFATYLSGEMAAINQGPVSRDCFGT